VKGAAIIGIVAGCGLLGASGVTVTGQVRAAAQRLQTGVAEAAAKPAVAIANDAEAPYCTPAFKTSGLTW